MNGLLAHAKSYPLFIDTRADSSAQAMMDDLAHGDIDCGILWGPMAGYFASQANPPLVVVPLIKETTGPQMIYRIGMAVRPCGPGVEAHAQQADHGKPGRDQQALDQLQHPDPRRDQRADHRETLSKRP